MTCHYNNVAEKASSAEGGRENVGEVKLLKFCAIASSWLTISCVLAGPAFAQDDASQSNEDARTSAVKDSAPILVTGTRIARRDYTEVSPVVTMNAAALDQSGQPTLEFGLNMLPQMDTGTSASAVQNRTGRASLNLRGLGEDRSLVLLDGRRIQPATAGGSVDITSIPSAIVQSVEVITGGASAAYGSDAMAGVVNFKLKDHYNGLMAEGKYNFTDGGGGGSEGVDLVGGGDFADGRGNALLVLSYSNRHRLLRRDREFFRTSTVNTRINELIANLANNPPTQAAVDQVFGQYGADPGAVKYNVNMGVNDDGTLFTPIPGSGRDIVNFRGTIDDATLIQNGRLVYNNGYYYDLISPLKRYSAFGRLRYDITDNIKWFGQAMFTSFENENQVARQSIGTAGTHASVPASNPFIPADLKTLLNSRSNPDASFPVTYGFTQLGNQTSLADWTVYQVVTGLSGSVGVRDWDWEIYGSHGKTEVSSWQTGVYNVRRLQELLDAPDGGASICDGGLDLFGTRENVSTACLGYISAEPHFLLGVKQSNLEATLNGSLFKLPGGDLRFALGADYRNEGYSENNDDQAVAGEIPGSTVAPSASGSRSVKEGFGELLIPLLADIPMVHRLEADIGLRYSDYQNAKGVWSYTASLNWQPVDFLTLRGGYSRSIRAPTLEDLFASEQAISLSIGNPSLTGSQGDPCDVRSSYRNGPDAATIRDFCIALGVPASGVDSYTLDRQTLFGSASGNPNLKNETGKSITGGFIFESPFSSPMLSRLRFSVDYFDIKITDAIGQLPLGAAFQRCFNLDAGHSNPNYDPNNVNCSFFPRDPQTGLIRRIESRILNLGQLRTRGVDFQLDWQIPFAPLGKSSGTLALNVTATYLDKFEIQSLPGTPALDYAGYGARPTIYPKIKALTSLTYAQGPIQTTLRWRFVDGVKNQALISNPQSTATGAPNYNYFDASFAYQMTDDTKLRFIVANLFNKRPYVLGSTPGETDQSTYDVIGRNYTITLTQEF